MLKKFIFHSSIFQHIETTWKICNTLNNKIKWLGFILSLKQLFIYNKHKTFNTENEIKENIPLKTNQKLSIMIYQKRKKMFYTLVEHTPLAHNT